MARLIGSLPKHKYVFIDSRFTHEQPCGFVDVIWFGLVSRTGRTWGCNIRFDFGAVYRELPPHAIAFREDAEPEWSPEQAQMWDCYGYEWVAHEYTYLRGLRCRAMVCGKAYEGDYLFTVAPMEDGFSDEPEQAKEFMFIELDNGRLTIQPTNRVLFFDRSFSSDEPMPRLKVQTESWSCEN